MKKFLSVLVIALISQLSFSQVYTKKQSRHRFAQLNMGLDIQSSYGGSTQYFDQSGMLQTLNIDNNFSPRFLIGGTHFWGHCDFYIAIPLYFKTLTKENQELTVLRGVETVFKFYPWRIENNKLRAYVGSSLAPFYFEQSNKNFTNSSGPELNHTSFPLLGGLTFNRNNYLFEIGLAWNYNNRQEYHISRSVIKNVETPPIYTSLSFRYMLETTLSAEKDWESGRTQEITEILASQGRLNSFYLGAGISSAFWLSENEYNKDQRPYINKYDTSIMPDFTIGYYLHDSDINLGIAYRGYGASSNSYGAVQVAKRKSILFEVAKYLFDYHGFTPFLGPSLSFEKLSFKEVFEGIETIDEHENKLGYGLTFGWDIRPNRIQNWLLRTNLRWHPTLSLDLKASESNISFKNLEFNFIQLIIYPNRMKKRNTKD